MSDTWRFPSRNPEDTQNAARALAAAIGERGLLVSLTGPLGAGKTVFAKGLAAGCGLDPAGVASPTFVIASEYPTPRGGSFIHVDLYRVESRDELEAAGLADWLDPGNLIVIEWGDRFSQALPADRLEVSISRAESQTRESERFVHALSSGPVSAAVLARWRAAGTSGFEPINRC